MVVGGRFSWQLKKARAPASGKQNNTATKTMAIPSRYQPLTPASPKTSNWPKMMSMGLSTRGGSGVKTMECPGVAIKRHTGQQHQALVRANGVPRFSTSPAAFTSQTGYQLQLKAKGTALPALGPLGKRLGTMEDIGGMTIAVTRITAVTATKALTGLDPNVTTMDVGLATIAAATPSTEGGAALHHGALNSLRVKKKKGAKRPQNSVFWNFSEEKEVL